MFEFILTLTYREAFLDCIISNVVMQKINHSVTTIAALIINNTINACVACWLIG